MNNCKPTFFHPTCKGNTDIFIFFPVPNINIPYTLTCLQRNYVNSFLNKVF